MFIPEFWCGVIATVGIEVVSLIGIAVWQTLKKK